MISAHSAREKRLKMKAGLKKREKGRREEVRGEPHEAAPRACKSHNLM
jgi:hypothetical protein